MADTAPTATVAAMDTYTSRPQDPANILAAKIVAATVILTAITALGWHLDTTLPPLTMHAVSVLALYWLAASMWTIERAHREPPISTPSAPGWF